MCTLKAEYTANPRQSVNKALAVRTVLEAARQELAAAAARNQYSTRLHIAIHNAVAETVVLAYIAAAVCKTLSNRRRPI